jgi:V8-like Glu-specific endopeptidase
MNIDHLARLRGMLSQVDPTGFSQMKESLEARTAGSGEVYLDVLRTDVARSEADFALEALDVLSRGDAVDAEHRFALEAIVMPFHRPVVDIVENQMKTEQLTRKWEHLAEAKLRARIEQCFLSVGRINVPTLSSLPYAGTGFIVGPDLLMTNRHVAEIFTQGLGRHRLQFRSGQNAICNCYHEHGGAKSEPLPVDDVLMIHPYWDMALLNVKGLTEQRPHFKLSIKDPGEMTDRQIVVIGYPGYDPTGDSEFQRIQDRIFRGTYYVKRAQPGQLRQRQAIESYGRQVLAITHDSSTLGGNSGSVVLVLPERDEEEVQVVGLHFAGEYLVANYAVPTSDLALDSRIVDAGVKFAEAAEPQGAFYAPYWGEVDTERASSVSEPPLQTRDVKPVQVVRPDQVVALSSTTTWTIPIEVSITVGQPTLRGSRADAAEVQPATEGMFGRRPPAQTSGLPYPFTTASLIRPRFDWTTALSLALASRLSYEAPASVQATACGVWGMEKCQFIEADDTQCLVASTAQAVLVAFRGTESVGDWLADLNVVSRTRPYGVVHQGFLAAFQAIEPQLVEALNALPSRVLLLTGHSLGGALATIAAAEWYERLPAKWIMTFGQPAVGKGTFVQFMQPQTASFFRFVNDDDIVARVPPTYHHVGRLIHFDAAGNVPTGPETPGGPDARARQETIDSGPMLNEAEFDRMRAQLLEARSRRRAPGLEALEAPNVEGLLPSISDHSLDSYISKIAERVGLDPAG